MAVAVGHKPEALALLRRTSLLRGVETPFRIEPEVGKVPQDTSKPSGDNNVGHVLQEHVLGSHVSDDAVAMGPEMPGVVKPSPLSGLREGLAGESGSNDIHLAVPVSAVEGLDLIPDRRLIQSLLFHPCHEARRRVGIPFTVAYGSCESSKGKLEAAISGAEMKGT